MGSLLGTHPSALGLLFFPVPNTQSQKILRSELETEIITVQHDIKLLKRGYQLIFRWEANWKQCVSWNKTFSAKSKTHFKRCNWGLKMNEKPNTEWILTTLQNKRNSYIHYYPKIVKLPQAVHHITHNKDIKCKLNCQCVLTNNNSRPKNEKGWGCRWRFNQSTSSGSHPSKLFRFDCFPVRLKRLERVHLE